MFGFNAKKRHFGKMLNGVKTMIWDLEFKVFKVRQIREDVRVEYDNLKAKREVVKGNIEKEKTTPTMSKDEAARLDDELVLIDRDIERYQQQMEGLDLEIDGSAATNQYPDGVPGLTQQIDQLQDLKVIIKDYKKRL